MGITYRPKASLGVDKERVPLVLKRATSMQTGLTANAARFPSLPVLLAVFSGQLTNLATAQSNMSTRGTTTKSVRDGFRDVLWSSMENIRGYVQSVADASPAEAVTLIQLAGLEVAPTAHHEKPLLAVDLTGVPGTVVVKINATALVGKTSKKVTFNSQYSVDGGHTWIKGTSSAVTEFEISGLPLMTTVQVQVSATLGKTVYPWSAIVPIMVH